MNSINREECGSLIFMLKLFIIKLDNLFIICLQNLGINQDCRPLFMGKAKSVERMVFDGCGLFQSI